jgi:hypothetical protein
VFDPGSAGETFNVGGNPTGNDPGQTVGQGNTTSGTGGSYVPVNQVIADYLAQATSALDQADIPPSMRALIQAYFDALAAGTGP